MKEKIKNLQKKQRYPLDKVRLKVYYRANIPKRTKPEGRIRQ